MALNINANEGQTDQNQQPDQQKDPTMNQNPNTGFGAPPQDQGQPQNQQPDMSQQNPPQQGPGVPQGGWQENPNQQPINTQGTETHHAPASNPQPNNQGGGFANTFGNPGGNPNPAPAQGGFGGQPNNQPTQNNGFGNQPAPQAQQPQSDQAVPANLIKTGADAYQAFQNAQQSQGGDRRFFLKQGEERTVIFLDGDLDGNGFFTNPVTREHTVKMGNKYQNILCLNEQEPCPLCQLAGENSPVSRASFVCYFTVLDRTGYTDQTGNRHADFTSIYVAKTNTLKQLQAFAKKLGGLRGQEMTLTRTQSNNAPRVGDMFIPGQKWDIQGQIIPYFQQQGRKPEEFQPFDYTKAITYYSADQLRSMGFNDGHFSGSPAGMGGGMNQQPNNQGGGFGGQPSNPPQQNSGFGGHNPGNPAPQNSAAPQGGFGGPQQNAPVQGGFGGQGGPGPNPTTNPNHDFSQDM